jgi:two-component system, cell cycle sensor histidine kinase and response regulator CckA
VLEDERAVRTLTRVILERSGYRVLDAATFDAALALLETEPNRIDLLVTDLVMPGLSGHAAYERLAATQPGMKVLYMSGYTSNVMGESGRLEPGRAFLEKPFTADRLTAAVRQVLDQR